ncbi:MAG TPA: ABC transporter permease [bacterium]|nr:ABC transporter permease [bacterium]
MSRYILGRVAQSLVLLFLVAVITFALIHAAPGGPGIMMNDQKLTAAEMKAMAANLGLDRPLYVQFGDWLAQLAQGNLGIAYTSDLPVTRMIAARLPATLLLGASALFLSLAIAIPVGIVTAIRPRSIVDNVVSALSFVGVSTPVFWLGLMLIIVFAVDLKVMPAAGMRTQGAALTTPDLLRHLAMPAFVLATAFMAGFSRYVRTAMIEVLAQPYVRTAHSKGLSGRVVLYRHALRNSLIPLVTMVGLALPLLIGGAAITEQVFAWPGMGQLAVQAAYSHDYPLIMGITIVVAAAVIGINLLTDLSYAVIDPRIDLDLRAGQAGG